MATPSAYYQFSFNGFLMGAGTPYPILKVDGLEALPDLRVQDDNQGYNDGMFSGRDFLSGRTITIQMLTTAGNGNSAHANFNLLQQAMLPQQSGTGVLQFQLSPSDAIQRIDVRVRKRMTAIDPEYTYGFIQSVWTLFAPDPRYYDDKLQTLGLSAVTIPGRTYNRTYNLSFGGGSGVVSGTVVNEGSWTTQPVITVNGPVTNPTVGNSTTGKFVQVTTSLGASDSLVVDLSQRLVTLNGSPVRNLLAAGSDWFDAAPGSSTFYFSGQNTTAGVSGATISYRNAYV